MPEQAKPSGGALRAADKIEALIHPDGSSMKMTGACPGSYAIGNIIDRETGVAELLEAAKFGLAYIKDDRLVPPSYGGKYGSATDDVERIEQAIAKAERGA